MTKPLQINLFTLPRKVLFRHILIWICLTIYVTLSNFVDGSSLSEIVFVTLFLANFIICYYLLLLIVFPSFFNTFFHLIISIFLVSALFVFLDYMNLKKILPYFGGATPSSQLGLFDFISRSVLLFSFVAFSALGSFLNWRAIKRLQEVKEKEKEVILSELGFLKNQFNSHLTFNFLNFCYSKILKISTSAANSIESFSEMLHYSLNIKINEEIPLYEEINYLENFISIQKCISTNASIKLHIEGDVQTQTIVPMLLSVLVENSTKHGILSDPEHPVYIFIKVEKNNLKFIVENLKQSHKIINSTGIGLDNFRQTLKLLYNNNHSYVIEETDKTYRSILILNLKSPV